MGRKAASVAAALFLSLVAFAALLPTQSLVTPESTLGWQPRVMFAPPSSESGNGLPANLMTSVNGWQAQNLMANNTLAGYRYRNATFSDYPPSAYSVAWQNITISSLTATYDVREVQYASSSTSSLKAVPNPPSGSFQRLAMRFTTADKVNITGVWIYYGLSALVNATLTIVSTGTVNSTKPDQGTPTIIGTGSIKPRIGYGWDYIKLSSPATVTRGEYYWVVVDASPLGPGEYLDWYYSIDQGGEDGKFAAAYRSPQGWFDEAALTLVVPGGNFINFIMMLRVLPLSSSSIAQVRTYSSPSEVDMWELSSGTRILSNKTRISASYHTFILSTNTSVTFAANWTARFEYSQSNVVSTYYNALNGVTFWDASFSTGDKPGNPYTWYNLTFLIRPISSYWNVPYPSSNVSNTRGYPFNFVTGSDYYFITQTYDVNSSSPWSNSWLIEAKSLYSIIASAPTDVIQGQPFNITALAAVLPCSRTILVFDRADATLYNRTFSITYSPYEHPLRLNATGDNNIVVFDRGVLQNEASFFNASWINVLRALTQMSIETPTANATWGDLIPVRVNYRNATQGVKPFPSSTLPSFSVGGYGIPTVTNEGGGWYSFDYPSNRQPAAGSYALTVSSNYLGSYSNSTTLSLNLAKINMTMSIIMEQESVSVGSSLVVSALLAFSNGTPVPYGLSMHFDFMVTYTNGSSGTIVILESTSSGMATTSVLATGDMQSITVHATYDGSPILTSATKSRDNIPVTVARIPVIMIIAAIGGVAGVVVIVGALAIKRRVTHKRQEEYRKATPLRQAASLAQLVVVDLKSGRSVYSKNLGTEESVDPQLISGFFHANQAVLSEAFKGEKCAGLKFADYGKYKVLCSVGQQVMSTLFCTEGADKELEGVLDKFTAKFERKYANKLETWDGDTKSFSDADEIVSDVFALPLFSPYQLDSEALAKAKLSGVEKDVVDRARRISAIRGIFFMTRIVEFLLSEQKVSRGKVMDVIASLTKKGVFKQLTIDEAQEIVKKRASS